MVAGVRRTLAIADRAVANDETTDPTAGGHRAVRDVRAFEVNDRRHAAPPLRIAARSGRVTKWQRQDIPDRKRAIAGPGFRSVMTAVMTRGP